MFIYASKKKETHQKFFLIFFILFSFFIFKSQISFSFAQNSNNLNEQQIIKTVKEYFLKHPEFLLEVQESLVKKKNIEKKAFQKEKISELKDSLFHDKTDIILGNPKAKKSIVEFFDYNCVYCRKNSVAISEILKENPDVRLILKDLPILSEDSLKVHVVAQAFYQLMPEKFNDFFEKMMLTHGSLTEKIAIDTALSYGADKKALSNKMKDPQIIDKLVNNNKLAKELKIEGTPAYIIKDQLLPGAVEKSFLLKELR